MMRTTKASKLLLKRDLRHLHTTGVTGVTRVSGSPLRGRVAANKAEAPVTPVTGYF